MLDKDNPKVLLYAYQLVKEFPAKEGKDALRVLNGVDIIIPKQKSVSIVGASGSGKSTLLHILGGLDRPTGGGVLYRGTDLTKLNSDELATFRNKNLGFVFQFHHLLPEFNALENVFMPALITGKPMSEIRDRASHLLDRLGLGGRMNHRPSELSGGEQQRVAICRALMNEPDLILADEPTGNLDESSTKNLLDILFGLVEEEDLTLVLVTHDMNIAHSCDIQYRLEKGKILEEADSV